MSWWMTRYSQEDDLPKDREDVEKELARDEMKLPPSPHRFEPDRPFPLRLSSS